MARNQHKNQLLDTRRWRTVGAWLARTFAMIRDVLRRQQLAEGIDQILPPLADQVARRIGVRAGRRDDRAKKKRKRSKINRNFDPLDFMT